MFRMSSGRLWKGCLRGSATRGRGSAQGGVNAWGGGCQTLRTIMLCRQHVRDVAHRCSPIIYLRILSDVCSISSESLSEKLGRRTFRSGYDPGGAMDIKGAWKLLRAVDPFNDASTRKLHWMVLGGKDPQSQLSKTFFGLKIAWKLRTVMSSNVYVLYFSTTWVIDPFDKTLDGSTLQHIK